MNDVELCNEIDKLEKKEHDLLILCKNTNNDKEKLKYIHQMIEISNQEIKLLDDNKNIDEPYFKSKNYLNCTKHHLELNLISYKQIKMGEVNAIDLVYECKKCGKNRQINIIHIID